MEETNKLEEELIKATKDEDIEKVKNLIAKGVNVNTHWNTFGLTPLHLAATIGSTQLVDLLLKAGADVDSEASFKTTPLHLAAYMGEEKVCEILLNAGAKINAVSEIGQRTPLHFAMLKANYSVIELLLDYGADPYARDSNGRTPIDLADPPIREMILRKLEERRRFVRFVKGLMSVDEDKFLAEWIRKAAEMCEIKEGKVDVGGALLLLAAYENKEETAKALLKLGANPNIQDKDEMTPFHHAAVNLNEELVTALYNAGADGNIKDNSGISGFDYLKMKRGEKYGSLHSEEAKRRG